MHVDHVGQLIGQKKGIPHSTAIVLALGLYLMPGVGLHRYAHTVKEASSICGVG